MLMMFDGVIAVLLLPESGAKVTTRSKLRSRKDLKFPSATTTIMRVKVPSLPASPKEMNSGECNRLLTATTRSRQLMIASILSKNKTKGHPTLYPTMRNKATLFPINGSVGASADSTNTNSNSSMNNSSKDITPVGWALIVAVGAVVGFLCFLCACLWCQRHQHQRRRSSNDIGNYSDDTKTNNNKRSPLQLQQDEQSSSHQDDDEDDIEEGSFPPPPPSQASRQPAQYPRRSNWATEFFAPDVEQTTNILAGNGAVVVPPVVQLDDDHRSLANTTLGDQTAGRKKRRTRKRKPSVGVSSGTAATSSSSTKIIALQNSFDESSLYTTTSRNHRTIVMTSSHGTTALSSTRPHQSRKPKMTWKTQQPADDDEKEHGKIRPLNPNDNEDHKESVEILIGASDNLRRQHPSTATGARSSSTSPIQVDAAHNMVDESSILTPRAPFKGKFSPFHALKHLSDETMVMTFEDRDDDDDDEEGGIDHNEVGTVDVDDLMTDVGEDSSDYKKERRGLTSSSSPDSSSSTSRKLQKMIMFGLPDRVWPDDAEEEKHEVEFMEADFSQEVSFFDPPGNYNGPTTATPTNKKNVSSLRKLPPSPLDRKWRKQTSQRDHRQRSSMNTNATNTKKAETPESPRSNLASPESNLDLRPRKNQHLSNMTDAAKTLNHRSSIQHSHSARSKTLPPPSTSQGTDENALPRKFPVADSYIRPATTGDGLLRGWKQNAAPSDEGKSLSLVEHLLHQRAAVSTLSGPALKEDKVEQEPSKNPDTISVSSSSSTALSDNPWLFDALEDTLGPRSPSADMESLSGRSNRSGRSHKSQRSNRSRSSRKSTKSYRSCKASMTSSKRRKRIGGGQSVASPNSSKTSSRGDDNEFENIEPRSLEHDLKRLEMQLAALEHQVTDLAATETSSRGGASRSVTSPTSSVHKHKLPLKQRRVVIAPPGKLGVVLANRHDGVGTLVSEVKSTSVLNGRITAGDKLIAVDDDDVTGMVVSEIISLIASRSEKERRLTVITTKSRGNSQAQ